MLSSMMCSPLTSVLALQLLLAWGADPGKPCHGGSLPITAAVARGNSAIASCLAEGTRP